MNDISFLETSVDFDIKVEKKAEAILVNNKYGYLAIINYKEYPEFKEYAYGSTEQEAIHHATKKLLSLYPKSSLKNL